MKQRMLIWAGIVLTLALAASSAAAQPLGGVTFHDVATADNGITYERGPSALHENIGELQQIGTATLGTLLFEYPMKGNGAPGLALLDYDLDGDVDLYVTDGPGRDNSLYRNRLAEDGHFSLELIPGGGGAAATEQDSTGVCFGDTDNDGDPDMLVLGRQEPHRFFENRSGQWIDVTATGGSDISGDAGTPCSCAMGDVNGDGLLDVFVANTFDWVSKAAIVVEPWKHNEYNNLYLNLGGNRFKDVSAESGIRNRRDISWGVVMYDYDGDGDLDIIVANDQGAVPLYKYGGFNRGFVRVYRNDGAVRFTDVTAQAGLTWPGDYMGFAVADYDGNGAIDFYASNSGDWTLLLFGVPYALGDLTSRWFLNDGKGRFLDVGLNPEVRSSGWSWGASAFDYDNDGDFDIVTYGGQDTGPILDVSNPGTLLNNDGHARFRLDFAAYDGSVDHTRRVSHGLATGDLDGNGFEDIVSVSDTNAEPFFPVIPYPFGFGGPLQGKAALIPSWIIQPDNTFKWSGVPLLPGTLAIELNSGGNGNGSVEVRTVGTVGIATGGRNNRDGIGAVVRFTPAGGRTASQPILGGASHSSQDSLLAHFGLGTAHDGMIEVVWQGKVRNRLYGVQEGERVRFPEIPCDFSGKPIKGKARAAYTACVAKALIEIQAAGLLTADEAARFGASALLALGTKR